MDKQFLEMMTKRRAIREYDSGFKIPRAEMNQMIEEASTAPSSMNVQPWRFLVVDSYDGKEKLRPFVMGNTKQNDTSSAMVIIFGDMKNYELLDKIFDEEVEAGNMPKEDAKNRAEKIRKMYSGLSDKAMGDIVKVDTGLVAMQFMLAAEAHGYKTSPMGGFEKDKVAEAFGLDPERYIPTIMIGIGKGVIEGSPSTRLAAEEVTWYK